MVDQRRQRGFVLADIFIGFAMLGILLAVVMSNHYQHRRGIERLDARRVIVRQAEAALVAIQTSDQAYERYAKQIGDTKLGLERLQNEPAPDGFVWVKVTAQLESNEASVMGLVPGSRKGAGDED